jgi:hypothetical protein
MEPQVYLRALLSFTACASSGVVRSLPCRKPVTSTQRVLCVPFAIPVQRRRTSGKLLVDVQVHVCADVCLAT